MIKLVLTIFICSFITLGCSTAKNHRMNPTRGIANYQDICVRLLTEEQLDPVEKLDKIYQFLEDEWALAAAPYIKSAELDENILSLREIIGDKETVKQLEKNLNDIETIIAQESELLRNMGRNPFEYSPQFEYYRVYLDDTIFRMSKEIEKNMSELEYLFKTNWESKSSPYIKEASLDKGVLKLKKILGDEAALKKLQEYHREIKKVIENESQYLERIGRSGLQYSPQLNSYDMYLSDVIYQLNEAIHPSF